MEKKDKVITVIIVLLMLCIFFFYKPNLNENQIFQIITFYSLLFGFTLTSFSVLVGSSEVRKLYLVDDEKSGTKLHVLKNYYKITFYICVISAFMLLFAQIFNIVTLYYFIIPMSFTSVVPLYRLLNILFDIFVNKKILIK